MIAGSGMGLLARRGLADRTFLSTKKELMRLGQGNPLQLLSYLPDLHPSVGLAVWNALRLTCAPGDLKIKAVKPDGKQEMHKKGTAAIEELWNSLPNEVGGMRGLQTSLTLQAMLTGMCCIEGVPGVTMGGLFDVCPVDSLTIRFDRDRETMHAVPWQRQIWPEHVEKPSDLMGGFRRLSNETFFWRTVDPWPDDLYGRAPYATALNEILCDIAMTQDLRDAVHNAAWPRLGFGFNFKEMFAVALAQGIEDPEKAAEWVNDRFAEVQAAVGGMKADDNVFFDANGDLKTIEGSKGFSALKEILVYLRQRIIQSLKTLPTLMGINDGSTQTYTSVEWQIFAAGLETIRSLVADLLVDVANLHLRLLGMPLIAIAEYTPIRTTDALIEANTMATQLQNAKENVRLGFWTLEDACQNLHGSSPAGEPMPGALGPDKVEEYPAAAPASDPGKTQEETDAAKPGKQDGAKAWASVPELVAELASQGVHLSLDASSMPDPGEPPTKAEYEDYLGFCAICDLAGRNSPSIVQYLQNVRTTS